MEFDREFTIQYISDQWKSIYGSRFDFELLNSMTDESLKTLSKIVENFIKENNI